MRLVFVNYAHPDTPHISGVRLWRFAEELASAGHQVVHVTATLDGEIGINTEEVSTLLKQHDWERPLHIAVKPSRRVILDLARGKRLPAIFRRAVTAYAMVVKGGAFYDWTDAAKELSIELGGIFKPDLVWGTFGNSSNLHLAQGISKFSSSKLVLDFKDSITAFVPRGTRWWFIRRNKYVSGLTSNARVLGDEAYRFLGVHYECIYSGVDSAFYSFNTSMSLQQKKKQSVFFTLTGSIYSEVLAKSLLDCFARWCEAKNRESNLQIRLKYFGGNVSMIEKICSDLDIGSSVVVNAYAPIEQLADACTSINTVANMYIFGNSFHHKLLELLAAGKSVISFGGELDESFDLAATCNNSLYAPETESDLVISFTRALESYLATQSVSTRTDAYGWPSMATKLESYFSGLVKNS